jgi:hypothetical protein
MERAARESTIVHSFLPISLSPYLPLCISPGKEPGLSAKAKRARMSGL